MKQELTFQQRDKRFGPLSHNKRYHYVAFVFYCNACAQSI